MEKQMEWSKDAQTTLEIAGEEAGRRGSEQVSSMHILLGLVICDNLTSKIFGTLLSRNGKRVIDLHGALDAKIKPDGPPLTEEYEPRYSREAQRSTSAASDLARNAGLSEVGCDHLLLGCFSQSLACRGFLEHHGITREKFNHELDSILNF